MSTRADAVHVFIPLTARALDPGMVIVARSNLPSTDQKLRSAGATTPVSSRGAEHRMAA